MKSKPAHQACLKILLWLITEIVLEFVNLDTLSDYSEFLFEKEFFINTANVTRITT